MKSRIFISYDHDDRDAAKRLAGVLESRGFSVWWDWNILGGQHFRSEIQRELDRADKVLVLWSPESLKSRWVREESGLAARDGKLVQVVIDNLDFVELPEKLADLPTVEVCDWQADLDRVVAVLRGEKHQLQLETKRQRTWLRLGPAASWDTLRTFGEQGLLSPSLGYSAVAFAPDGRSAASGTGSGDVIVWDVETGEEIRRFGSLNTKLKKYRTVAGAIAGIFRAPSASEPESISEIRISSLVWTSDSLRVVTGGFDGTVRLWDPYTGRQRRKLVGHPSWVLSVDVSVDGRHLVSAGSDRWNTVQAADGTLETHRVAAGLDRTLLLWDARTRRLLHRLGETRIPVWAVRFSPDGRQIASHHHADVKLWEVASGRELRTLKGGDQAIRSLAFSPDGRFLLAGGNETESTLWDLKTGAVVRRFQGRQGVPAVVFSPDGRTAVAAGEEGTVRLWDIESGHLIRTYLGHNGAVTDVDISTDGRMLISASQDGTLKLCEVPQV